MSQLLWLPDLYWRSSVSCQGLMQKGRQEGRRLSGVSLGYSDSLHLLMQTVLDDEGPFPLKYLLRKVDLYTREGYVVCKTYDSLKGYLG